MTLLLGVEVAGLDVLVAGGGPRAARQAADLAREGARVRVVAAEVCEDLADLVAAGRVTWTPREVDPARDVEGRWLVAALTGDRVVDAALADRCRELRVLCVPATARPATTARAGEITVGVVDGAACGGRAAAVRDAVADLLRSGAAPVRRRDATGPGRVVLVGGGPGDPDLLTLRGRRALAEADVVVTDRLGPLAVLDELAPGVEVVDVGKAPGRHPMTQAEITATLVERARRGQVVVRLKGGDPFVLGRGGEEVAGCRAAGVPVEVVPGVTSALAAPAVAGIPVTHRGTSRGVLVVNGHDALTGREDGGHGLDWPLLARWDGTLVVLMGVAALPELASRLVAEGRDPSTPVALVERATLPGQRTTRARLDDVAVVAAATGVRSPAVVVVGEVAGPQLAEALGEPVPATMAR